MKIDMIGKRFGRLVVKDTSTEMVLVHRYSDKTIKTMMKGNSNDEN